MNGRQGKGQFVAYYTNLLQCLPYRESHLQETWWVSERSYHHQAVQPFGKRPPTRQYPNDSAGVEYLGTESLKGRIY